MIWNAPWYEKNKTSHDCTHREEVLLEVLAAVAAGRGWRAVAVMAEECAATSARGERSERRSWANSRPDSEADTIWGCLVEGLAECVLWGTWEAAQHDPRHVAEHILTSSPQQKKIIHVYQKINVKISMWSINDKIKKEFFWPCIRRAGKRQTWEGRPRPPRWQASESCCCALEGGGCYHKHPDESVVYATEILVLITGTSWKKKHIYYLFHLEIFAPHKMDELWIYLDTEPFAPLVNAWHFGRKPKWQILANYNFSARHLCVPNVSVFY